MPESNRPYLTADIAAIRKWENLRMSPYTMTNSKLAVWGALSLYLNFINIFQLLLGLTGEREG